MTKLFIFTLILLFPSLASLAEEPVKINHELERVNGIFNAYHDYKGYNIESCINTMEDYGFSIAKNTFDEIQKGVKVDTLYFEDTDAANYIFVRTVDLGYLRTITGSVTLKCENAQFVAEEFVQKLTGSNILASVEFSHSENKLTVKDNMSFIAFDDRWKEEVTTEFLSFFNCDVTVLGEYVDISFEEIVPLRYEILNNDVLGGKKNFRPGL